MAIKSSLLKRIEAEKRRLANLPETRFYVLKSKTPDGAVFISKEPVLPNYNDNWIKGTRIEVELPSPLIYEIESFDEHQRVFEDYMYSLHAPLMSRRLIARLRSLGVNNLDTYDATIRFNRTGELNNDFQAVNILGLVRASDTTKSESSNSPLTSSNEVGTNTWFDKLVLDENLVVDLLLFRMMESATTVLIDTSIKEAIEDEFSDLEFFHPENY